jgi:hypothetical protein
MSVTVGFPDPSGTGVSASSTYNVNIVGAPPNVVMPPNDSQPPRPMCQYKGHKIGGELIHYVDGLIVGYCEDCDCRIQIDWFPGGSSVARVKGLVAEIAARSDVPEDVVEQFHRAIELLEEDAEAIEDARELIPLGKAMIARKLRG